MRDRLDAAAVKMDEVQSNRTLVNAAAIATAVIAARKIGDFGERLGELSIKWREGAISGEEFALSIAKQVPIMGDTIKLIEGVREAITGLKAAQAEAARLDKQRVALIEGARDAMVHALDATGKLRDGWIELQRDLQRGLDRDRLGDTLAGRLHDLATRAGEARAKLLDGFKQGIAAIERARVPGVPQEFLDLQTRILRRMAEQTGELQDQRLQYDSIAEVVNTVAGRAEGIAQSIAAWFAPIKSAQQQADAMIERLRIQLATFGKSPIEAEIMRLARQGAGPKALQEIRDLQAKLDKLKADADAANVKPERDRAIRVDAPAVPQLTGLVDAIDRIQAGALAGGGDSGPVVKQLQRVATAQAETRKAVKESGAAIVAAVKAAAFGVLQ
jgi:hypothetical protein